MATILSDTLAEELVSIARTATGDSLRSVTYFSRSDFEQLYLRSDLERDADLDTFVGHEWRGYRETNNAYQTTETELGAHRYTIRAFENGYLLRVGTERAGVLLTTDDVTMQEFEEIAEAVSRSLEDHSESSEHDT
ncbi:DUF7522 family protein [Halapricum hydrolyticum]|uniref:Uncharacterized protein n=1 Tax=Halapricum hydrolyticum TaxID=2979991 RepID=A0AAE3IA54_9EURY|nr:hypothetical protein [Halapricum hydrolyticum]MCU4717726.1 hypothetical protein [Halapricum hydrolyticum]MCU4726745.1 hypothetical protein [Halapricum hydrolyticum]